MRRRRNPTPQRNPLGVALAPALLIGAGGFWVAGNSGQLPGDVQTFWNRVFNKGRPPAGATITTAATRPTGNPVLPGPAQRPAAASPISVGSASPVTGAGARAFLPPSLGGTNPESKAVVAPGGPGQAGGGGAQQVIVVPADTVPNAGPGDPGFVDPVESQPFHFDFWADKFDYEVGDTIRMYGSFTYNGEPLGGASIDLLDPSNGDKFTTVNTGYDGTFSWDYKGRDIQPWRAYAFLSGYDAPYFDFGGVHWLRFGPYQTGYLDFRPYGNLIEVASGAAKTQYATLYQKYNNMEQAWNSYSAPASAVSQDRVQQFHDHWQKVQDAINQLVNTGQALDNATLDSLTQWADYWVNDIAVTAASGTISE